mgnify:CR=1 FL=1
MKETNAIVCDLCDKEFNATKDTLEDQHVTLTKEGLDPHEVILTVLTCPHCGKSYPVIMDDDTTLPLLERARNVALKRLKQMRRGFTPKPELEAKYRELNRKLDFKRQKLAEKYSESFYQLEDGTTVQLDYRYHVR